MSPLFADKAAPAAFCCAPDLAGMSISSITLSSYNALSDTWFVQMTARPALPIQLRWMLANAIADARFDHYGHIRLGEAEQKNARRPKCLPIGRGCLSLDWLIPHN